MVYIKLNRRHVASILFFFSTTLLTVCAVFIFILFNAKSFLIEELPKDSSNNGNRKSLEIFYNEKQGITRVKDKNFRKQSIDYNFNVFNKTDDNMRNSPTHTTNTVDSDIKNILVTPTKSLQKEKINQIKSATQLQYEVSGISSESEETIYIDDFELRSPYIAHPNQDDLKRKEQIQDFKSSEMLPGGDKSSIGIILNTKIQKNALVNSDPSKFLKNYEQNKNAFRRNRLRDSKIHSGLGQHPAITAIDDEDLTLTSSGSGDFETVNQMLSGHYDYENIPNIADKKTKAKSNRRIRLNSISYPLNNEQRNRKQKKMFLKSKCKSLSNRSNCLNKRNNSTDVSTDTELSISKSNFSTNYQLRELKNIPTHQRSISKNIVKSKNLYDTIDGASEIGNSRINSTNNSMEIKTRRVMGNFKKSKERSRQLLLCEEAGGGELCRMLFKDNEIE